MKLLLALACATSSSPKSSDSAVDSAAPAAPLEDPAALDGGVFSVQPWDATWVLPENANGLLNLLDEPTPLLLEAHLDSAGALSFLVGAQADFGQDVCLPTTELPTASLAADPWFEAGPADATLPWGGAQVELEALHFTGRFTPDGHDWDAGTLSGTLHAESLAPAFQLEEGQVCGAFAGFGVDCEPCADGRADCLPFQLEDMSAERIYADPLEVVERRGCHEACDEDCLE